MRAFHFERRSGFGMIAGPVSGRRGAWDFDDADTHGAFVAAAKAGGLGDVVRRMEAGYSDQTPGGGRRWIVRYGELLSGSDRCSWLDHLQTRAGQGCLLREAGRLGERGSSLLR